MLKKGAKLRVSHRQPAQYFADLGVLMQEQTTEKEHKSDQQLSKRRPIPDAKMDDANEEEKEE